MPPPLEPEQEVQIARWIEQGRSVTEIQELFRRTWGARCGRGTVTRIREEIGAPPPPELQAREQVRARLRQTREDNQRAAHPGQDASPPGDGRGRAGTVGTVGTVGYQDPSSGPHPGTTPGRPGPIPGPCRAGGAAAPDAAGAAPASPGAANPGDPANPGQDPAAPVNVVGLLRRSLREAEQVASTPDLSARERREALKLVCDLAKQLRDAERDQLDTERAPRVVLYFPARDELVRLEGDEHGP